jgi:hypothetical protein
VLVAGLEGFEKVVKAPEPPAPVVLDDLVRARFTHRPRQVTTFLG